MTLYQAMAMIREQLSAEDRWTLAWKLMDEIGVAPIISLSVDDVMESRAEFGEPQLSREEILEAIDEVAEQDWTLYADGVRYALDQRLDEIVKEKA